MNCQNLAVAKVALEVLERKIMNSLILASLMTIGQFYPVYVVPQPVYPVVVPVVIYPTPPPPPVFIPIYVPMPQPVPIYNPYYFIIWR